MLLPTIVCAICRRASDGHDRYGACLLLRRERQAAPMTQASYAALRGMVRKFERTRG